MRYRLRFSDKGGRGVVTAGEILVEAVIKKGRQAFKASTYASQMREGPAKVGIIIDDKGILFPHTVEGEVNFMFSITNRGYRDFRGGVERGGVIIVEPSLVYPESENYKKWRIFEIPITAMARDEVGNMAAQPVATLAIAIYVSRYINLDILKETILRVAPAKAGDTSSKTFDLSVKYV